MVGDTQQSTNKDGYSHWSRAPSGCLECIRWCEASSSLVSSQCKQVGADWDSPQDITFSSYSSYRRLSMVERGVHRESTPSHLKYPRRPGAREERAGSADRGSQVPCLVGLLAMGSMPNTQPPQLMLGLVRIGNRSGLNRPAGRTLSKCRQAECCCMCARKVING